MLARRRRWPDMTRLLITSVVLLCYCTNWFSLVVKCEHQQRHRPSLAPPTEHQQQRKQHKQQHYQHGRPSPSPATADRRALSDYSVFSYKEGQSQQPQQQQQQPDARRKDEEPIPPPSSLTNQYHPGNFDSSPYKFDHLHSLHHRPYVVYIPNPYPVYIEKKVPYPIKVPISPGYTVENIPSSHADNSFPAKQSYQIYLEKTVPYTIEKQIPYSVNIPGESTYPVKLAVVNSVPLHIEKPVHYPINVPLDTSLPISLANPIPYHVENQIPYPVVIPQHQQIYPVTAHPQDNIKSEEREGTNEQGGFLVHVNNLHKYVQAKKYTENSDQQTKDNESGESETSEKIDQEELQTEVDQIKDHEANKRELEANNTVKQSEITLFL